MHIHKLKDSNILKTSVVTFGNFDGLHVGHIQIINKLNKIANHEGIKSVLISFKPHTNIILKDSNFKILTPFESKIDLLKQLNIDIFCTIDFDENFSKLNADSFMNIIIDKYNPSHIIFGYDNYFGYQKSGSFEYIKNNIKYKDIKSIQVNKYGNNEFNIKSSTIKQLISSSKIEEANTYLFKKYALYGLVIKGESIGSTIGFPTANIKIKKEQIIPSNGVYSVNLFVDGVKYLGVCNIGFCPTLKDIDSVSVEVHVIDERVNFYNKDVIIEFNRYIRNEIKFKSINDLANQIKDDIANAKDERKIKSE